jgi:peptidoglycan hydrolase-like protein with peptidoglycan-binding domain
MHIQSRPALDRKSFTTTLISSVAVLVVASACSDDSGRFPNTLPGAILPTGSIESGEPGARIDRDLGPGAEGSDVHTLQRYLTRYGYFPNPELGRTFPQWRPLVEESPSDGIYDRQTEEAVRALQRVGGLEQTGVVDEHTRTLLATPRCSIPDGIPSMDPRDKFMLQNSAWATGTEVTWSFTGSGVTGISVEQAKLEIAQAFRTWGAAIPSSGLKFKEATSNPHLTLTFGSPGDPTSFAVSTFPNSPSPRTILFNAAKPWSTETPTPSTKLDFQTVVLHEIGHALGLQHSTLGNGQTTAAMNAFHNMAPDGRQKRSLSSDETLAIDIIYDKWKAAVPGSCTKDIGAGADGSVWAIGCDDKVKKYNPATEAWDIALPEKTGLAIAVDPQGKPWVVQTNNTLIRRNTSGTAALNPEATTWTSITSAANCTRDVAVAANGDVWIINGFCGNAWGWDYKWNPATDSWSWGGGGELTRIAVEGDGTPWGIRPIDGWGYLYRRTTNNVSTGYWEYLYGPGYNPDDIGVYRSGGLVKTWLTTKNPEQLWVYHKQLSTPGAAAWQWVFGSAKRVAVGPCGPWVVQSGGATYRRYNCENALTSDPVSETGNWIRSQQASFSPGQGKAIPHSANRVMPYSANLAALGMLTDPNSIREVRLWIEWYFANLNSNDPSTPFDENGTIYDHWVNAQGQLVKETIPGGATAACPSGSKCYESAAAYGATFLSVVRRYHAAGDDEAKQYVLGKQADIERVGQMIVSLKHGSGTGADGLYWHQPGAIPPPQTQADPEKLLTSNTEVYQGLRDLGALCQKFPSGCAIHNYATEATNLATAIKTHLLYESATEETNKYYYPKKKLDGTKPAPNLSVFTPDAVSQLYPIINDLVIGPKDDDDEDLSKTVDEDELGDLLYGKFKAQFPDWASRLYDTTGKPWLSIGYAARIMGDSENVRRLVARGLSYTDRADPLAAGFSPMEAGALLRIAERSRIGIPAYQYPANCTQYPTHEACTPVKYWETLQTSISPTMKMIVMNPNNGVFENADSQYTEQRNLARANGAIVIGYVHTRSNGVRRQVADVKANITKYYEKYAIDGIFVDQVNPADCSEVAEDYFWFYKQLYQHVKDQATGPKIVVLNPGTKTPECYMQISDILVNFEGARKIPPGSSTPYTRWTPNGWEASYPATRFWHIVHTSEADKLTDVINMSRSRNAGWVYITERVYSPDERYRFIPAYWGPEIAAATNP